ncbi:MAG: hypothetical protein ACREH5_02695 [Candidatus Omnitrophota bacterium]
MKRRNFPFNEPGFTVTELITAVVLAMIIGVAFFSAYYVFRNAFYQQTAYYNSNRSVRFALDSISKDAKEAIAVVPARGGDTTGTQVLILRLPSINNAGEPSDINSQYDYVTYKLDPNDNSVLIRDLDVLGGGSVRNNGQDAFGKVIGQTIQTLQFSSGGTNLSGLSASAISGLKVLNANVAARDTTILSSQTQTSQLDADIRLRNNLD